MIYIALMKILLILKLNNWNVLASRQATFLFPHLILNSHLPLNLWICLERSSITYQRLPIYLQRILIAKNLSEEVSNHKHSMTTYLKKMKIESLKTEIISSLESTIYSNCICQIDNLRTKIEKETKLLTTQQHLTTSLTIFF